MPDLPLLSEPVSAPKYALQATAWAALSGIGLALVIPCVQAIIAELYSPYERGRAFGFLFTVSALGGFPVCLPALVRACHVQNWRTSFLEGAGGDFLLVSA